MGADGLEFADPAHRDPTSHRERGEAAVRGLHDEVVVEPVVGERLQAFVLLDGHLRGREGGAMHVDAGRDLVGAGQGRIR